jgi:hypothetical protein
MLGSYRMTTASQRIFYVAYHHVDPSEGGMIQQFQLAAYLETNLVTLSVIQGAKAGQLI